MMAKLENDLYTSLKRINERLELVSQLPNWSVEINDFVFPDQWQTVELNDNSQLLTGKASTRLLHQDDQQVIISNIYYPGLYIRTHHHPEHHEHLHIISGSLLVNDIRINGYLKILADFPHRVKVDELSVVVIKFEKV